MLSKISTIVFQGIKALPVIVEVYLAPGLPNFSIVGLADKTVSESKERIRASFHYLGLSLPSMRITVNLSPADLQKEGSHYDLPIALALLSSLKVLDSVEMEEYCAIGELKLDSALPRVSGVLSAAMYAIENELGFICPSSCGQEAAWSGHKKIIAAPTLLSLINHFKGKKVLSQPVPPKYVNHSLENPLNFQDIKGQSFAKRALEIAAAGGHNLLMIGPPGAGKSMLAQSFPSIFPPLSPREALDISLIHSLAGILPQSGLVIKRPFRAPHHSASLPALVGGGARCKPGEISLAHNGVLFLDELPEFSRAALESLRQPLETRNIMIARANNHISYPANFQLIAAMNPCRCGYWGDEKRQCKRNDLCSKDYLNKLSGPLLDRFDLCVYLKELSTADMLSSPLGEASAIIAERVVNARIFQSTRLGSDLKSNALLSSKEVEDSINLDEDTKSFLTLAIQKTHLSGRGYYRLLKVTRTIADLERSSVVEKKHLSEALSYRHII